MCENANIYGFFNMKFTVHSGWQNGAKYLWVPPIPQVYKLGYGTCTWKTCDLKPAGFPVPMTNPTDRSSSGGVEVQARGSQELA
jgi:hypothetical protein